MSYDLTGKLQGLSRDFDTGKITLTLTINEMSEVRRLFDDKRDTEKLSICIDDYSESRTGRANRYMWQLCGKLADAMTTKRDIYTKDDIYRKAIREVGIYKDFEDMTPADAKTLRAAWEMLGTGWITEQLDYMPDGEGVIIRCYYGSSKYTVRQMSRLIDYIVQDCVALGIETKDPAEVASLLDEWGKEKAKEKERG